MKIPKVSIVGIPNVGKSTLFNKLCGKKKSIVHNQAGMTRDSVKEKVIYEDNIFELIDTGGFFEENNEIYNIVKERVIESVKDSDLILFLIDSRRELLPIEKELYRILKRIGVEILIVLNKVDTENEEKIEEIVNDFHFSEKTIPISAEHNLRIYELFDEIMKRIPHKKASQVKNKILKIAIVGKTNVGKSSILNKIINRERAIVSSQPHTTRDILDEEISYNKKQIIIMDTAGIRKLTKLKSSKEKAAIIKAQKTIPDSDVVVFVLDISSPWTRQDMQIAGMIKENMKPVVMVLNKWDIFQGQEIPNNIIKEINKTFHFMNFAPKLFVSAKTGKNINRILEMANFVYENYTKRIQTAEVNKLFATIHNRTPILTENSNPVKIKYITQIKIAPPVFALFSGRKEKLKPSAERFLERKFREAYDFTGTPIKFVVRKK